MTPLRQHIYHLQLNPTRILSSSKDDAGTFHAGNPTPYGVAPTPSSFVFGTSLSQCALAMLVLSILCCGSSSGPFNSVLSTGVLPSTTDVSIRSIRNDAILASSPCRRGCCQPCVLFNLVFFDAGATGDLELIYLAQSPYSLRVRFVQSSPCYTHDVVEQWMMLMWQLLQSRWVLNYHQLNYKGKAYTPIAEEPFLRLRTGRLNTAERISVPILLMGHSDGETCGHACYPAHAHSGSRESCCLPDAKCMLPANAA